MTIITDSTVLPDIGMLTIDDSLDSAQAEALVLAARRFYAFWDTGDVRHLDAAIAAEFHDHTLPAGRPQGPAGPPAASQCFRAAVPDLRCEIEDLLVVGDKVAARLRWRGSFTGVLGDRQGAGEPIDFMVIDVLGVRDGRIVANWHLENIAILMQQLGVASL
jgi:predicted ester cyclase